MTIALRYLEDVKARLAASPCIARIEVVTERSIQNRGYFRARLVLINEDFLELSEYFIIRQNKPETLEYRYQWMDSEKQTLIRRWDNARHFPNLAHFPDHIHLAGDNQVIPGQAMNIFELIEVIEQEIGLQPAR